MTSPHRTPMPSPLPPVRRATPSLVALPAIVLLAFWLLLAAPAAAAPDGAASTEPGEQLPPTLTLERAVELSLGSHPAVAAARARREAAQHGLGEAKAYELPWVTGAASGTYNDQPVPTTPIHGFGPGEFPQFDNTLLQGSVTVDYLVTDGGAREGRIGQGEARTAAAVAALDEVSQATAARTAEAYLRVLTESAVLDAHQRRLDALGAERARVKLRFDAGRAAEVEVRRVDAAVAAARAEKVRTEAALDTARADLARQIGVTPPAVAAARLVPVSLADPALPPRDALLSAAVERSPQVEQARQALHEAEAAVRVAKAVQRPKLHAVGSVLGFGSSEGDFQEEWNAGLRLSVPIFAGGADRERIAGAEARRDAAVQNLAAAELAVGEALDRALAAVRESSAGADALAEAAASYAEVVRIERLRRDAGVGTETDYLSAEADLLSSRAQLAEARHGEIRARVELARVAGRLDLPWFEDSLTPAPPTPTSPPDEPMLEAQP